MDTWLYNKENPNGELFKSVSKEDIASMLEDGWQDVPYVEDSAKVESKVKSDKHPHFSELNDEQALAATLALLDEAKEGSGVKFMTFKAKAKAFIGEGSPNKKDELVAALEGLIE